jgi:chromosome condensin MukBEF complex kleisin-like MukF subunit
MGRHGWIIALLAAGALVGGMCAPAHAQQKKDYLSEIEADKIRDAETATLRIHLFLSFAADRLRKVEYESGRTSRDRQWIERMNGLLNAYAGCVDDAADILQAALEKQENLRSAIKEMQSKTKEFRVALEKVAAESPERERYKDALEDALQATAEAAATADKVAKEAPAPPERRKP